jgi:hypothetical protein
MLSSRKLSLPKSNNLKTQEDLTMAVSFEVKTSTQKVIKFTSRACFAAVNNITGIGSSKIEWIKYLPFFNRTWSNDDSMDVESQEMDKYMSWDLSKKWWTYMMSLPFITDIMINKPKTLKAFKAGFTVHTNHPADRVMVVLFLLRAPQYQSGIVRTWEYLVDTLKINKDTAFAMAFGLNNYNQVSMKTDKEFLANAFARVTTYMCRESTIIHPQHFTIKGAKLLINRLLCDDYDTQLYQGAQDTFYSQNCYHRAESTVQAALGRFFCKKPGSSHLRGNFQLTVLNDIKGLSLSNRTSIDDLRHQELSLSTENLIDLANLLES